MNPENSKKFEYEIFARINRGDDLMHIGVVEAETDDLARVYAAFIYNEEDWTDMCVIRKDHFVWVKRPQGLFEKAGA